MKHRAWCIVLCALFAHIYPQTDKEQRMKAYYRNKNVLVTGGCGFIGSHIVHTLISYDALVTVLDDLSTGSLSNIASTRNKITFIEGSVTDAAVCAQAVAGKTHVFHLAAFISVPQSVQEPSLCHAVNVDGTFNMLEAARQAKCTRFVFSSSAAVYGTPDGPCSEETICKPLSPYGFSKLIGEQLCMQYAHTYGLETVMLRYFNVYGERQDPYGHYAAVVAKFTDLIKKNKPVTIFGDGLQTRDFIPVEQVVEANLMVGMLPAEQVMARQFNVATGKSITLLELLDQLKTTYRNYQQEPQFASARAGDIKESSANCARLHALY